MDRVIHVSVCNKVAKNDCSVVYVCGNSDYSIEFAFDEEWNGLDTKTARFISNGKYVDVVFTGNRCDMPVMSNTNTITVGVYAGNLKTTTPAVIFASKSILCDGGVPADPMPDVYAQIMALLNAGGGEVTDEQIAQAVSKYIEENPVQETDPTVPDWAKQPEKPTYTAEEVGAQPKGDYALKSDIPEIPEIPAPYVLPTASATVKGGVRVGDGLQMDGDVLGVVPEGEWVLIEEIPITEEVTSVERTKEPDGTPLKLSKAIILSLVPKVESTEGYQAMYAAVGETHAILASGSKFVAGAEYVTRYLFENKNKIWEGSGQYGYQAGESLTVGQVSAQKMLTMENLPSIGYVRVYTFGKAFPAGMIIRIWGVRADA